MHKARSAWLRTVRLPGLLIAGIWLSVGTASSQQTTSFHPILELERPVYVADEAIRFWIGVTAEAPIPEALHSSCIVHMVRPDGRRTAEQVSWPPDGNPWAGWKGGWGFGDQSPSLGRYVVSFEFAGQRTADQSIEADWVFVDTKSGGDIHTRGALLHVSNQTDRVLHFAKPGLLGSEVWLTVETIQPPSSESTFVPQSALLPADEVPAFSFDRLEWSNQSRWPMVTVPGGSSVDRKLVLQSAYPFREGQEYEVTISTVLTVFVGESNDTDAQLFPLRIRASATTQFRW